MFTEMEFLLFLGAIAAIIASVAIIAMSVL